MSIIAKQHWIFKIKGTQKYHMASANKDDEGRPFNSTLCGKTYDPNDRIDASKGIASFPHLWAADKLCLNCGRQLADSIGQLRSLFISAGQTEDEATKLADSVLNLKRS